MEDRQNQSEASRRGPNNGKDTERTGNAGEEIRAPTRGHGRGESAARGQPNPSEGGRSRITKRRGAKEGREEGA